MSKKTHPSVLARIRRRKSIRKKVVGTQERPRLSVFRSTKHIYAQVIDDASGSTIVAVSTLSKELRELVEGKPKREQAKLVGVAIGKACLEKSVTTVAFDRNGFIYHGRVAAVADGAREAGLDF